MKSVKEFFKILGFAILTITISAMFFLVGLKTARFIRFKVAESVRPAKIKIENYKLNPVIRLVKDGKTYCSGVVIDKNTIVTAAHCVIIQTEFGAFADPTAVIEIRASDSVYRATFARLKSASTQIDRAVLKGDFQIFEPSKYLSDMAQNVAIRVPGEQLKSCGYPLGGALYCGDMIYIKELAFFMSVKGILVPGMSGGPTMLLDGTVVGVNSAVEDDHSIIAPMYNIEMYK